MDVDLDTLLSVTRVGGGVAVFVWAFLWLIKRGDGLQRENIDELRRQRDYYRMRAEAAEGELSRRLDTGELPVMRAHLDNQETEQ